jgi:sulfite reductase (NADPH) flavoprotein alpha-component
VADPSLVPARRVFEAARAYNRQVGHENAGFLSAEHGFLPFEPPLQALPLPYEAWDAVATELPGLFRHLRVRAAIESLPALSFGPDDLPDRYLLRASALVSVLAHAYMRMDARPPSQLPATVQRSWETLGRRLERPSAFLSYIDLILYNWKLTSAANEGHGDYRDRLIERMDLLFPTVGNPEERIFYLTQVEIAAAATPVILAIIRAQEAAFHDDPGALETELLAIVRTLRQITGRSLYKIDPNPHSRTYVDQVVWAKTVAPFAVPVQPGQPGPSGTAAPLFHLMDAFLSRPSYESHLGHEAAKLAALSPRHWRDLIAAVGQISVREYIARKGQEPLEGAFDALLDSYAGDKGYLGAHRLKAYGFLEIAFKAGRSVTIGGFKGLFHDKTWNQIDHELASTRDERFIGLTPRPFPVRAVPNASDHAQVAVDARGRGLHYEPGDRVGIWPENDPALVQRTLAALRADGREPVPLNGAWRAALRQRTAHPPDVESLPLAELLRYARIRPLPRSALKTLYSLSASDAVRQILAQRLEEQLELWDVLEALAEAGFDPRCLWKAELWEAQHITRIAPPDRPRLYSIASAPDANAALHLTIADLQYTSLATPLAPARSRRGTASGFLHRVVHEPDAQRLMSLKPVSALRFHLPDDPTRPVVMFAAGSGIAPFLGFLQARGRLPESGANWLFYGVRELDDVQGRDLFEQLSAQGRLQLRVSCSRQDEILMNDPAGLLRRPAPRGHLGAAIEAEAEALWDLLRSRDQHGAEASFYICGRTDIATLVMHALQNVFRRYLPDPAAAQSAFYQLMAQRRLMLDVFSTYTAPDEHAAHLFDASEVVLHNSADTGYWMVLGGRVLDLSEFVHLHAGGRRILANNAGIDATRAYQSVQHHLHPEIDAQLGMYEIGRIRRLDFGGRWGVGVGPQGLFCFSLEEAFVTWVRYLYLVTEMENAVTSDSSFFDRSTTRDEPATELTPLKIHLLAEAHKRFIATYLDGVLGEDLQLVWAIASGLHDPHALVLELRGAVEAATSSADAALVRGPLLQAWLDEALQANGQSDRPLDTGFLGDACDLLRRADLACFAALKHALRQGVQAFEQHEALVIERAGPQLLAAARQIPQVAAEYYSNLAGDLRALAERYHVPIKVVPAVAEVPTLLTGHGAHVTGRPHDPEA